MKHVRSLRQAAFELLAYANKEDAIQDIKNRYDINIDSTPDLDIVNVLYDSLKRLPPDLVRDCGIKTLGFEDLGPSAEYYPNHGKYVDNTLVLNNQIVEDPTLIVDPESGAGFNKFDQTLYHELGHGWDDVNKTGSNTLSLDKDWMDLSGWTVNPKPGYKRIRIRDRGHPELIGEYYYSPEAGFTRFYAKRNPWDDWADSFSYYVAGLKSFLPEDKIAYFDEKLGKYYKG